MQYPTRVKISNGLKRYYLRKHFFGFFSGLFYWLCAIAFIVVIGWCGHYEMLSLGIGR